jgi:phosphatidylserine decarboxylase
VPRKGLSRLVGKIVHAQKPKFWADFVKKKLIEKFNIDCSEAEHPPEFYPSFGAFFARRLKAGARDYSGQGLLSPCDGSLEQWGQISEGQLIQCKGKTYSLAVLLNDRELARSYEGGFYMTIYLAPYNYHRVHWAVGGNMLTTRFIQGDMWPVNKTSVEHVSELFCLNERYTTDQSCEKGKVNTVMVSATNVGDMELFHINPEQRQVLERTGGGCVVHQDQTKVPAGAEFGIFNMGSTVILLLDRDAAESYDFSPLVSGKICAGQVLAQTLP